MHEIVYFLGTGSPLAHLSKDERKRLVVRCRHFTILDGLLYHQSHHGISRRAIREDEKAAVLESAHSSVAGGHKVGYGGQMCTRIPSSMHVNVIHVKESANLPRDIGWPISRFYH
jgi:hypothetical protein